MLHYKACFENPKNLKKYVNSSNIFSKYGYKSYKYEEDGYINRLKPKNFNIPTVPTISEYIKNNDDVSKYVEDKDDSSNHTMVMAATNCGNTESLGYLLDFTRNFSKTLPKDDYKPDNKSCLDSYGKICSEIIHDGSCTFDQFLWDDKQRIIGVNTILESNKNGSLLVEEITNIGCAHSSTDRNHHFNQDVDLKNINCDSIINIWTNVMENNNWNTESENKYYSNFKKCIKRSESIQDHILNINSKPILACGFSYSEECNLSSSYGLTISLTKSDIDGYKFVFMEKGSFN